MWILLLSTIYTVHVLYNYMLPWYWYRNQPIKNGEEQLLRMRDVISSSILEDCTGFQFAEWGMTPHQYHAERKKLF
jgi:hypothetical protein